SPNPHNHDRRMRPSPRAAIAGPFRASLARICDDGNARGKVYATRNCPCLDEFFSGDLPMPASGRRTLAGSDSLADLHLPLARAPVVAALQMGSCSTSVSLCRLSLRERTPFSGSERRQTETLPLLSLPCGDCPSVLKNICLAGKASAELLHSFAPGQGAD